MRIIHCADLHLDSKLNTHLTSEQAKMRRGELLNTFNRMIDFAVKNNVDGIIIAGDLFDSQRISATARKLVQSAIADNGNITFYYLKGNHELDSFCESFEQLPDNLKLFGDRWTSYVKDTKEGRRVVVTGIELNRDNSNIAGNSLALNVDDFNIVVMHGQESESVMSGKAEVITIKEYRNKGIDYMALGHIHSYKKAQLDARGVYCYSGCLEGRGFDEAGEHGFVLLEINEEDGTFSAELTDIAYRDVYVLDVDVTGCMDTAQIIGRVDDEISAKMCRGEDYVKVVLRGELDVECDKDIAAITAGFSSDYYVFKVSDETVLKVDYEQYALDTSLKGEFVRAVMEATDIDDVQKADVIRYGIKSLLGEEVQ